jgi:hypothetical protein
MKQSCNKKEKNRKKKNFKREKTRKKKQKNTLTNRNFFKTLKNRNKLKTCKINIFKHETKKGNKINNLKRKLKNR